MAGHDHTPEIHEHADDWHHHAPAEGRPQHEHAAIVDSGALMKWFAGIVISLVLTIVALSMYFQKYVAEQRARSVETIVTSIQANERREAAMKALSMDTLGNELPAAKFEYKVADKKAKTVTLPIQTAMERVIAKYNQKTETPAGK